MSLVHEVVCYLATEDNYSKLRGIVTKDMLPSEGNYILSNLEDYLKHKGTVTVTDWDDFNTYLNLKGKPSIDSVFLEEIKAARVSDETCQLLIDRAMAASMADHALHVAAGSGGDWDTLANIFDKYKRQSVKLSKRLQDHEVEDDLLEILSVPRSRGLSWALPIWDTLIGRLSTEFVIVAARPDGGKTTFLCQNAVHWANQLAATDRIVLWFNNEEARQKIKKRLVMSGLGITESEIELNPVSVYNDYIAAVRNENIVIVDDANHISVVERAIEKYKPGVIIIDQLYKVQGTVGSADVMEAERFRTLCNWSREIGKHVAPVVVTNQLDGTAEGIMYPTQNMLYGSKTGAQGEADVILTIGRIPTSAESRFFHTPKNKITSSDLQVELSFDRFRGRFYEF